MSMIKALAIYAAMVAAAVSLAHPLEKMSRDQDTPIIQIAQAQAAAPFGAQTTPAQLDAIMSENSATISADKAALAKAEQGATP